MAYIQFPRGSSPSLKQVDYAMTPLKTATAPEPALFKNAATANPPAPAAVGPGKRKKKGKSNLFYGG